MHPCAAVEPQVVAIFPVVHGTRTHLRGRRHPKRSSSIRLQAHLRSVCKIGIFFENRAVPVQPSERPASGLLQTGYEIDRKAAHPSRPSRQLHESAGQDSTMPGGAPRRRAGLHDAGQDSTTPGRTPRRGRDSTMPGGTPRCRAGFRVAGGTPRCGRGSTTRAGKRSV